MQARHQTLCLNMIVKNEAPVIARCLASVRPIIDYWVIVDTGSTDGTQDAIRTSMADLPGELHERPWRDFGHNRTEALHLARSHGDYTLIIDSDDVLELPHDFKMPRLKADSYLLEIRHANLCYWRPQLVCNDRPWRFEGVLHELLTCGRDKRNQRIFAENRPQEYLRGPYIRMTEEGARRRLPESERYSRDASVLARALERETDPFLRSRYTFYLAQSYRDCGEKEKALQAYLTRANLGFWIQEVYMSLYSAAKLHEALGRPFDEVMATYLRAANVFASRAEALHGASRYCRLSKRYKEGYEIAKRASLSGEAPDGLFVEPWIYEYGLLDELAVNAYWAGAYQDCLDACERILRERKCPEAERPRIEANAAFARQQLGIGNIAGSATTEVRVAAEARTYDTVRYAMITPYYKEERRLLERCIDSVRNQSLRTDHFLVADGFPQDWIDTAGVRHFKLDRCHGDVGNTPRGIGALIAIAEEYSAIGMLDADNWLEPDHVEACVAAASTTPTPCDYVVAQRTFRRIDGRIMPLLEEPGLVDTSCFFFLRGAFCIVPHWAMMPKELSAGGDRVFYSMLRQRDFVAARVSKPTVHYQNLYESSYRDLGETPPPGAKPNVNLDATAWLSSLSQRDNEIARRLIGFISADGLPLVVTENRHEKRIFPHSHSAWPLVVSFYGGGEQWLGHALVDFFDSVAPTGPRSELCRIMTEEKSDKGSGWHNYTLFYHFLFRHRRYEITSVFELGVGTNFSDVPSHMGEGGTPGASLRGWRRYFPRAKIFGADIDTRILFSEERISTFYVDQLSDNAVDNLWRMLPDESFDIIIDDGLHTFEANTTFFRGSIQKLKPNGYYIIEDIYTAPDNLNKYHEFFSSRPESGVIVKIPNHLNNCDNCLGIFRNDAPCKKLARQCV